MQVTHAGILTARISLLSDHMTQRLDPSAERLRTLVDEFEKLDEALKLKAEELLLNHGRKAETLVGVFRREWDRFLSETPLLSHSSAAKVDFFAAQQIREPPLS